MLYSCTTHRPLHLPACLPACADKRRVSEVVALGSAMQARLVWGTLQEAAALATLAQLFPGSCIEEVRCAALLGLPSALSQHSGDDPARSFRQHHTA